MKEKITDHLLETEVNIKGSSAEVTLKKVDLDDLDKAYASETLSKVRGAFMRTCAQPNKDFVDTETLSKPQALVGCAKSWLKNSSAPVVEAISNPAVNKVITSALSPDELKNFHAYVDKARTNVSLAKAMYEMNTDTLPMQETTNWERVGAENREEYAEAKTKKQWDKIDKKELKKDTKKEKKEHEKDAVQDDESKIKKLKKDKPSEKKSVEEHDLKKDEKFDKEDGAAKKGKGGLPPWLKKKGAGDEDEDENELKKDSKKEKEEHEKDAVKDDKKQIKDLKKDEKEDKKAEKKDKKAKAADYSKYWEQAAERFAGKKRSKLKDSDFLDPTNRSFPVMSCKNVSAAVSTWGMYKGPMSFETFKRKLTARAKKLGCEGSLPEKWKDK